MTTYGIAYRTSHGTAHRTAHSTAHNTVNRTVACGSRKSRSIGRNLLFWVAAFMIVVSVFLIAGNQLKAHEVQASSAYDQHVYYTSVEIQPGDTLWDIADEYMGTMYENKNEYIREVKRINHMRTDSIKAGSYLIVPYLDRAGK